MEALWSKSSLEHYWNSNKLKKSVISPQNPSNLSICEISHVLLDFFAAHRFPAAALKQLLLDAWLKLSDSAISANKTSNTRKANRNKCFQNKNLLSSLWEMLKVIGWNIKTVIVGISKDKKSCLSFYWFSKTDNMYTLKVQACKGG